MGEPRFRLKKFKILKLTNPQNLRVVEQVSKIMKIWKFRSSETDFKILTLKSDLPGTMSSSELVPLWETWRKLSLSSIDLQKTNLQKILAFGISRSSHGFLQSESSSDHSPSSRHVTFVTSVSPAPLVGNVPFLHLSSQIVPTSRSNDCLFESRHFINLSILSSLMSRQYVGSSSHSSTSYSIPTLELLFVSWGLAFSEIWPIWYGPYSMHHMDNIWYGMVYNKP